MTSITFFAQTSGFGDILQDTATTFGFHWKLFLSQCVSFAIVAFLLQRFAYKPIITVLEERRRRIEEGLANAEKIKARARRGGDALSGNFEQGKR